MAIKVFICYAHEDELLSQKLKLHLSILQRQGLIDVWHDRDINAGDEWERAIARQLSTANIILLLVSPDFMNSDYCYSIEMMRAMERHERGEAKVIPIILRPVYWQSAPFSKLQALPKDAKPVISSGWSNWDEAFSNVVEGIRKTIKQMNVSEVVDPSISNRQDTNNQEKLNRNAILAKLRKLYIISHDNISPGVVAGTDELPKEWVEEQLKKMGEHWRLDSYY
jgi:hypothetical protein